MIDLETWDYLVQAIISHGCSVQEMIEKAKSDNRHFNSRKMLLGQVLWEHYAVGQVSLSYLQNAHQYIDLL